MEKNTLLGRALVSVRTKIKNTLFGRSFVKIRAQIEKTHFVARLWFGLGRK